MKKNKQQIELEIKGMTCDSCASHVEQALRGVENIVQVKVPSWASGKAIIAVAGEVPDQQIADAVSRAGYQAKVKSRTAIDTTVPQFFIPKDEKKDFDLLVIGTGGAGMAAAIKASESGAKVAIVEMGTIGGTCVNVGCVPSKTLIRAAEAQHGAAHHAFAGIHSVSQVKDFKAVIDQKRELVNNLRQAKYVDVLDNLDKVELIHGKAQFNSSRSIQVNGRSVSASRIIIATGARPNIPPIPGLADSGYLTNESAFELEQLPVSLLVLGGRYIALEIAQMFARFGSKVTVLQRSSHILPMESPDVSDGLARYLAEEGIDIFTGVQIHQVERKKNGIEVKTTIDGAERLFRSSHLLAALGRKPASDSLALSSIGVALDDRGFINVADTLQTNQPGIFAAGDVIGEPMYVYTAAYEGSLAAENALTGAGKKRDYTALPWVIFTDPQLSGVGMDEHQAAQNGIDAETAVLSLEHVPRSLAARDTRGFIKLIRNKANDKLIGARILAPEGGELLMEVSLAIKYGIPVSELASQFHPYLTLSEGIKLAAITFNKDVGKLSCCAG